MNQTTKRSSYSIKKEYLQIPNFKLHPNRLFLAFFSIWIAMTRISFRWDKRIDAKTYHVPASGMPAIKIIKVQPKAPKKDRAALVYFHGGGFFLTYAGLHLEHIQDYALRADIQVFLVDYRLSYRYPFPAAMDDCYQALKWVYANSSMLGVRSDQIAVGGDSAGGALAATVAQIARDKKSVPLKAQYLIYPVIDSDCKTKSATEFTDTPIFASQDNMNMWDIYLRGSQYQRGEHRPKYASPIHCKTLKGLPPAYIESAEFDPLRDEAKNYADALKAAGVKVHFVETKGTIHGYEFVRGPTTKKYYASRLEYMVADFAAQKK